MGGISDTRTVRSRHRTPCAVTLDGRRHNGLVLDISLSGLFIQTSAKPNVGQRLDVEVVLGGQPMPMHVEVMRRKAVPPQLLTVAHGGIGVRILSAPEEFFQLLSDLEGRRGGKLGAPMEALREEIPREEPVEPPKPPKPFGSSRPMKRILPVAPDPQFRVRVKQTTGSRSRVMKVRSATPDAAGAKALAELGDGWTVLGVEPLEPT